MANDVFANSRMVPAEATDSLRADEISRLQVSRGKLMELAFHLRRCPECGDTDVTKCREGHQLWLACFPADAGADHG